LYHVISRKVLRRHLRNDIVKAVNEDNLRIGVFKSGRVVVNTSTNVTKFNVMASNGVVHFIDQVLTPPDDLVGTIFKDKRFTTLATAIEAAGLTSMLLNLSKEFTIFAPTNKAFDALGKGTVSALLKRPKALKSILLYHTVKGSVLKSDLKNSGSVKTEQGSNIHYSFNGKRLNINDSRVIEANILAANGIIHAIDKVLSIPE
jgi:transforming growth factor-beta-induced protein